MKSGVVPTLPAGEIIMNPAHRCIIWYMNGILSVTGIKRSNPELIVSAIQEEGDRSLTYNK